MALSMKPCAFAIPTARSCFAVSQSDAPASMYRVVFDSLVSAFTP